MKKQRRRAAPKVAAVSITTAKLATGYKDRGAIQLGCADFDDKLARLIRAGYEPQGSVITNAGHEGFNRYHVLVVKRRWC